MALDKKTQAMYNARSACPICNNDVPILLEYTGKFSVACRRCCKTWDLPTKMELCERYPLRPKVRCMRQAIKDWNALARIETWRTKYLDNGDGSLMRDMVRDDDGTSVDDIGTYEVVFDFKGQRFYCYIDAIDIDEAMERFWQQHPGVTMKHVVDTLGV